jgi:hypothetical protein
MQRHELEHLIRAAGAITGAEEIMVVGSQAILGSVPHASGILARSAEADLFTLRDPKDADLIDGTIGEGSPFHESFGYYAQGVWKDTATLPAGWEDRLVTFSNENTKWVMAKCLEPHDLAVAKLVAGREKDIEFLREMLAHGLIASATILDRIALLPEGAGEGADLYQRWARIERQAAGPGTVNPRSSAL